MQKAQATLRGIDNYHVHWLRRDGEFTDVEECTTTGNKIDSNV